VEAYTCPYAYVYACVQVCKPAHKHFRPLYGTKKALRWQSFKKERRLLIACKCFIEFVFFCTPNICAYTFNRFVVNKAMQNFVDEFYIGIGGVSY
jgi:hypothetical protein